MDVTETLAKTVIGSSDLPARSKPLYRQCYSKVTHAVTVKLEVIRTLNITVASSISFPPMEQQPLAVQGLPIGDYSRSHTALGSTPLDERSARRRDLYLTTHSTQKRQTSLQTGGIRTPNPCKGAAADPHLRQRGHWNRCFCIYEVFFFTSPNSARRIQGILKF